MPFSQQVFFDRDPNWGLYDVEGNLIAEAALLRGDQLTGQSQKLEFDLAAIPTLPDNKEYIYGGPLIPHYGHFILSSMSRLWAIPQRLSKDTMIVFHADHSLETLLQSEAYAPLLGLTLERLGLTLENSMVLNHPARISRMIVPAASVCEQSFAYPAFAEICHSIGHADIDAHRRVEHRPIYFTKTGLRSGVTRLSGECELEAALQAKGVEIVRPETLPLTEQIKLFSQKRTFMGVLGSAFHTSIFAPPVGRSIILSPGGYVSSNYLLIDGVNGSNVSYLEPNSGSTEVYHTDHFHVTYVLNDINEAITGLIAYL